MTRSAERQEFLIALVTTAIENYGYGWFLVHAYDCDAGTATIEATDEPGKLHNVTPDTMAHGLAVIRDAELFYDTEASRQHGTAVRVLHNAKTKARLFVSPNQRTAYITADHENEAGDFDVVDALAVLECGLFGRVVYA